jgi:hypothetical protein
MAEPLSLLGTLSASLHLAEKIFQYYVKFEDAPRHAQELVGEVRAVGHVMGMLRSHLEGEIERGNNAFDRTSVLFFAADGCGKQLEDVHDVLMPLLSNHSFRRFWNRLRWPLESEDAFNAIKSLHRYAQIFHFAVNLDGM